jgi:hypothetical protein
MSGLNLSYDELSLTTVVTMSKTFWEISVPKMLEVVAPNGVVSLADIVTEHGAQSRMS